MSTVHTTVLLKESIEGLDIRKGDIYIDGTLGGAGHTRYALEVSGGNLTVVGLDRDEDALVRSKKILSKEGEEGKGKIFLEKASYSDIDKVLTKLGIEKANRIMLDL